VKLDAGQLHTGSIVYSPTGADVSFQLSLIGQDAAQTHSESVRILRTRPSPLADNAPPAPQKTAAVEVHAEATPKPAAAPAAAEPVPAAENKGKTAPPALREFHAEVLSQRLRPARPSDLPEAPGLTPSSAPVAVSLPALNSAPSAPVAPAAPPPSAPAAAPVRAGGQLTQAQLISHKPPEYPLVAKQNHVQGVVEVSATIGVDGKVKAASAVSGPALLQKAAVDAVRQWLYKPTLLNGAPVESETLVDVRFTTDR